MINTILTTLTGRPQSKNVKTKTMSKSRHPIPQQKETDDGPIDFHTVIEIYTTEETLLLKLGSEIYCGKDKFCILTHQPRVGWFRSITDEPFPDISHKLTR